MNKTEKHLDTYAKSMLSDWKVLAELMAQHAVSNASLDSTEGAKEEPLNLLSDQQISETLNGPLQGFFKQKIKSYTTVARIQVELSLDKEDSLKGHRVELEKSKKIPESILTNYTLTDLANVLKSMDELTLEQHNQWLEQCNNWVNYLIQKLAENQVALSEIEADELMRENTISELLDRYIELNIETPKINKAKMTLADYLLLKVYLAIHSFLSRLHKPHQDPDIMKVLKLLKRDFDTLRKQEKQLLKQQSETL